MLACGAAHVRGGDEARGCFLDGSEVRRPSFPLPDAFLSVLAYPPFRGRLPSIPSKGTATRDHKRQKKAASPSTDLQLSSALRDAALCLY